MTAEKVQEVLELYETKLHAEIWGTGRHKAINRPSHLLHALGMIPQVYLFRKEGRIEKAFRWLGFIQGILYCEGVYTIEEMKNHNRPDGD